MIRCKLRERLFERGMNQLTFSKLIDVDKNIVNAYYNNYAKSYKPEHLDKMCAFLDCPLSDLIEYIPDKK
jgi:putative transcriptional regulator